jgi:hypothetical protein
MTDAPKFEVIDRRKLKQQEEGESASAPVPSPEPEMPAAAPSTEPAPGPRLVTSEPAASKAAPPAPKSEPAAEPQLPPMPTAEETTKQKAAYDASAQRVEDVIRAQNPGVGAQPQPTFEQLVHQFYVSGLIQMGAGTPEGQQPRIDIIGARATIDLLAILAEKTRGNLSESEDRMVQAALYELRMAFLEISGMISMPGVPPPPQPKR